MAHGFAAHEPDAITLHVDAEEAEYRERGLRDDRFWHELLRRNGPGLRGLLFEALHALRKADASIEADKIQPKLD